MIWLLSFLLFLLVTHYFFYPLFLFVGQKICRSNEWESDTLYYPTVSLVIAALNEEKTILRKIQNVFELHYPKGRLECIVVADGSTDRTVKILSESIFPNLQVLFEKERRGKAPALNRAVKKAKNEILVFTDANTLLEKESLKWLVTHFRSLSVGGVSGRKAILKSLTRESSKGDRTFWNFESRLKAWQSRTGSITTADGELFAMRRVLFNPLPDTAINDDMELTFQITTAGFSVKYEERAVAEEEASKYLEEDLNVKARMVLGGWRFIQAHRKLLLPPVSLYAFQILIHKGLRWSMPLLLAGVFAASFSLSFNSNAANFLFLVQLLFYASALVGAILKRFQSPLGPFYFPFYYCYMNWGAVLGFYYFLQRRNVLTVWQRAER